MPGLILLRLAALVCGATLILLGFGIVQQWNGFLPEHPVYLFTFAGILWLAGLWLWNVSAGLIALGSVIILLGAVLVFVYPQVVNAGSGQDAVGLFGFAGGVISGLIGLTFVVCGFVVRAVERHPPRVEQ